MTRGYAAWVGQFCVNVSDLDRFVALYEALGLVCTSRTEIDQAWEAIVENPAGGTKLQLAQQKAGPSPQGTALWKHYVNTTDIERTHAAALAAGCTEESAPVRMDRWPVSVSFVRDPDGHLVEFVERHPWGDDVPTGDVWMGQYCILVSDLDAAVARYEAFGLQCTSRTDITDHLEAIVETPGRGGKIQLAQRTTPHTIDMGSFWKLYVHTDDCAAAHAAALAARCREQLAPLRLERWPTTISFVVDPDGYLIEFVQRDPD